MRVSKMTVYRLVHNGELPAVRVGRSFRVHAKAVHDLLETLVLRRRLTRRAERVSRAVVAVFRLRRAAR